jgi:mannose-6-phosphate isomerase-like protein (cupin superfamily)
MERRNNMSTHHEALRAILHAASRGLILTLVAWLLPAATMWAEGPAPTAKAKKAIAKPLQPGIVKVDELLKRGLDQKAGGFNFTVLAQAKTGSVELFQIDEVKTHFHPRENHFLYILRGRAKGQIGAIAAEVGPGDLVIIPAGKKFRHKLAKIGDEPVSFLLFSTPPFDPKDITWVEQ